MLYAVILGDDSGMRFSPLFEQRLGREYRSLNLVLVWISIGKTHYFLQ